MAIDAVKGFTLGPLFTPPMMFEQGKTKGTLFRPSASGGANWSGAGVDPETGVLCAIEQRSDPDLFLQARRQGLQPSIYPRRLRECPARG